VSRRQRQSILEPTRALRDRGHKSSFTPTALIEAQLSPGGEPVLGLYLHVAYHTVMSTFGSKVGRGNVTPAMIGVVSLWRRTPASVKQNWPDSSVSSVRPSEPP
jgi:hypothetical protein